MSVPAPRSRLASAIRAALVGLSALLAGCATIVPPAPPPADLAAGPLAIDGHIREASTRFAIPETWIRAVMMRESDGRAFVNGRPLVSRAGAVGLMQIMPETYAELRGRHAFLGPDPSVPRDNILAGTAYLKELFDRFGAPGFVAAYNCGPGCYAAHQAGRRRLPRETRAYLQALAPVVAPGGRGGGGRATAKARAPAPRILLAERAGPGCTSARVPAARCSATRTD